MRRNNLKSIKLLGMAMLLVSMLAPKMMVQAAETSDEYLKTTIPVVIHAKNAPADYEYAVRIEAKTPESALPEETVVRRTGEGTVSFEITHQTPGNYEYEVHQVPQGAANMTYDEASYSVSVYVFNNADAQMIAYKDGNTDSKPNEIGFTNGYTQPTPAPTPDPSPSPDPGIDPGNDPTPTPATPVAPQEGGAVQGASREAVAAQEADDSAVQGAARDRGSDDEGGLVLGAIRSAATGDSGRMLLYGLAIVIAAGALIAWAVVGKKKRNTGK